MTEQYIKNHALLEIELLMRRSGSLLFHIDKIPKPDMSDVAKDKNTLITEELSYDRDALKSDLDRDLPKLIEEQRGVYNEIMTAVDNGTVGMFFVYGFGRIGKTFLWSVLGATIRSKGDILLNVASSGIAALLLKCGRTSHSRFGIPLQVNKGTMCSILKPGTNQTELVKLAKLIIWDEAPMMSKHCFETLDQSMRDILGKDVPFGGKPIVFCGDFRQILLVITDGGREQTVMAALNSPVQWKKCKVMKLTKNMRLVVNDLSIEQACALKKFSNWILDIGDGKINGGDDEDFEIDIPEDLFISDSSEPIKEIVKEVYGDSYAVQYDPKFF